MSVLVFDSFYSYLSLSIFVALWLSQYLNVMAITITYSSGKQKLRLIYKDIGRVAK